MGAPGLKYICRTGFAGRRAVRGLPAANRVDEVESLVDLRQREIPWDDVLFYRHTRAATFIRTTCTATARSLRAPVDPHSPT